MSEHDRTPSSVLGADHSRTSAGAVWRATEEQWREERRAAGLPIDPDHDEKTPSTQPEG